MASKAARAALEDAKVPYDDDRAGVLRATSTATARAGSAPSTRSGLTGIPVFNVNNNCSTGSTRAHARASRRSRAGWSSACSSSASRRWRRGRSASKFNDRENPISKHAKVMIDVQGFSQAPPTAQMFGGAGREYRWKYGTKKETFAKISEKARKHAANNPLRALQPRRSRSKRSWRARRSSTPSRATSAARRRAAPRRRSSARTSSRRSTAIANPVWIAAQAMTTDYATSFEPKSMIKMVGYDMTEERREEGLRAVGPRAGGRAGRRAARLLHGERAPHVRGASGSARRARPRSSSGTATTRTAARWSTNPSGGLLSKGHPLGATGLAQCTELVWQLRGQADKRQVQNAKVALQHNLGLGGACVVTMYRRD